MSRDRIRPVMSVLTCACTLVVLVGAAPFPGPSVADAAVLTWSADAPFADASTIAVDFGATLTGVTALEAVVTGMGGVQHWIIYQGVGNPTGSVPFNMALDCRDQGTDVLDQQEPELLQFLHDFASCQPARRRDPAVVLGHMLPHRLGFPAQGA